MTPVIPTTGGAERAQMILNSYAPATEDRLSVLGDLLKDLTEWVVDSGCPNKLADLAAMAQGLAEYRRSGCDTRSR